MKKLTYKRHKRRWIKCTRCKLHENRNKIVLARGVIPADILLIGEAPGVSEDVLGRPFVGPAGKLLEFLLKDSGALEYRILITNLVGCIPLGEEGKKLAQPEQRCIKACSKRLVEITRLANPRLVVYAGKLASKHGPPTVLKSLNYIPKMLNIIHPAAILRINDRSGQKGLVIQRTVVSIRDAIQDL